jgi:hypothetical protein
MNVAVKQSKDHTRIGDFDAAIAAQRKDSNRPAPNLDCFAPGARAFLED